MKKFVLSCFIFPFNLASNFQECIEVKCRNKTQSNDLLLRLEILE